MPLPNKGESQADYVKRYVESDEAKKTYPELAHRLAVAYSMFKEHQAKKFDAYPDGGNTVIAGEIERKKPKYKRE